MTKEDSDPATTQSMDIDEQEPKRAKKRSFQGLFYRSKLQECNHLLPGDLSSLIEGAYLMFAKPDGVRCILSSGSGQTMARNS
jgi:hypothetical protein